MSTVTRFAPSPTGFLHIGSARTALFNWLYARHTGGVMRLRIEDTDRQRSTDEAIDAILSGMKWLGLDWDGDVVYQFSRADRHREVVEELLSKDLAYKCYCTQEELEQMREKARIEKKPMKYDGTWRDRDPGDAPKGADYVVRFKAPQIGETTIEDHVQGRVTVSNSQLDDMVLLRSDGTPTYMLSVVVDDHDMDVTHIIRGDDHLNNAFRQYHLYKAMEWHVPDFAHIPLIHGPDGAKLSKRHGALGVEAYEEMGYLPEAMCNYLTRLGWSHGDDEIFSRAQAAEWFELNGIGRSAARFDFAKLENLNGHYIRESDNQRLVELILPILNNKGLSVDNQKMTWLANGMNGLKQRAKTIPALAESAEFYVKNLPLDMDDKASKILDDDGRDRLKKIFDHFEGEIEWSEESIEARSREIAEEIGCKLGEIAQPLRVALTGSTVSPSVFEIMSVFGKEESLNRIRAVI